MDSSQDTLQVLFCFMDSEGGDGRGRQNNVLHLSVYFHFLLSRLQLEDPHQCPTRLVTLPSAESQEFPLPDSPYSFNFVNSAGMMYEAQGVRECLQKGQTPFLS